MGRFLDKEEIQKRKHQYSTGDRVKAVYQSKESDGEEEHIKQGTVRYVDDTGGIHIEWDTGERTVLIHSKQYEIQLEEEERR